VILGESLATQILLYVFSSPLFGLYAFPHIYIPVEQKVMAGQFHVPCHSLYAKNVNMNGNTSEIFYS